MRKYSLIATAAFVTAFSFSAVAQRPDPAAAAERIDAKLAPLFKADEPGATVIVTVEGKPVFRKAYGVADYEKQVPLKPEDVMRLGSLTKQFTATGILLLEQDGKLSVDDDLAKHVPEIPPASKPTTLRHLLNQTSGIFSYTSMPDFGAANVKDVTLAEAVAYFKDQPRRFQPGEKYEYSNSNYLLLGLVIERASKMPYPEFMAKRIFEPLGMTSTAYEGHERAGGAKRVEGYGRPVVGKPEKAKVISMSWPAAAGALVSNVDDLAKWDRAITENKLLTKENWARMFTPGKLDSGEATRYGFGFIVRPLANRNAILHGGGIDGFQTIAARFPDEGVYMAILMNSIGAGTNSNQALQGVFEGYFGK
jgi:CubicO group peptidase (beta-lactamase class C family)